jgi:hypothetical protein
MLQLRLLEFGDRSRQPSSATATVAAAPCAHADSFTWAQIGAILTFKALDNRSIVKEGCVGLYIAVWDNHNVVCTLACLHCCCCTLQINSSNSTQPFRLLQLPDPELNCVLQKLDMHSLSNSALSCSKLRKAATASVTKAVLRCKTQEKLNSFRLWLQQHDSSITQCSIYAEVRNLLQPTPHLYLDYLPCPQLRQLCLKALSVQLEPAGDSPCILRDCTGLTALALQACTVKHPQAAFAAIAALPE